MSQTLCRFAECQYSVFVSYAGSDNVRYGHWASDFAEQLNEQLKAELAVYRSQATIDKIPEVHAYDINGINNGPLTESLQQRIESSFAMFVIVGRHYKDSPNCLAELRHFLETFDESGFKERLFIVALEDAEMEKLAKHVHWQKKYNDVPVYKEFYKKEIASPYVPVLRSDGKAPTSEFLQIFAPMRDTLIERIKTDLALPIDVSADWLIGGHEQTLKDAATALASQLSDRGKSVHVMHPGQASPQRMQAANNLIVPFVTGKSSIEAINLLTIWKKMHKNDDHVYLVEMQADNTCPTPVVPSWAPRQGLKCFSRQRFLDSIVSPGTTLHRMPRARLCIESNRHLQDHWTVLRDELEKHWNKLLADRGTTADKFPLLPSSLNTEQVQDYPLGDADGLLLLWGEDRDAHALISCINWVEDLSPNKPAPGIVAYLTPPKPKLDERPLALGWEILRFRQDPPTPPPTSVVPQLDDVNQLEKFLGRVYDRALRRIA